jgi:hypothetical protein
MIQDEVIESVASTSSPLLADFMRKEVERLSQIEPLKSSTLCKKLLTFLVERSLSSDDPISQYEVAEQGLDKPCNGDDSYPRVQVSRLRRMLTEVYAKTYVHSPPERGLYLYIPVRDYRAKVAAISTAYPDLVNEPKPEPSSPFFENIEKKAQSIPSDGHGSDRLQLSPIDDENPPLYDYLKTRVRISLGRLYLLYFSAALFFVTTISLLSILVYVSV